MAKKHYGGIDLQDQSKLRLFDANSSNYVSLRSPSTVSADVELTLPATDGNASELMATDGSGVLSFTKVADANVAAAAAIALNKLAAVTASRALVSDGSGFITASSVTSTELGYVSGVTSAIQTQLNAKASTALSNLASVAINTSLVSDTDNTDDLGSSAITWRYAYLKSGLQLQETGAGTDAILLRAPAALTSGYTITFPSNDGDSGQFLQTDGSGNLSWVEAAVDSHKSDWLTADGAAKTIVHNLASNDIMVQIFDTDTMANIEVDSVVRTDANTLDLVASSAPADTWRVLILAV